MGGCVTHADNGANLPATQGKTTEKMYLNNLARTSPLKNVEKAHELTQLLLSNISKRTKKKITNVVLGYRASQHKFKASAFHQSCKGKSNTILIAITTNNHIFGGFTPCTWTQDEYLTYQADDNCYSFLFSIQEGEIKSYKLKEDWNKHAIMNDEELGPVFGEGHDIHISDEADKHDSWNNLGKSYECDFKFGSLKANSLLTSEEKYRLKEYEIWYVQLS